MNRIAVTCVLFLASFAPTALAQCNGRWIVGAVDHPVGFPQFVRLAVWDPDGAGPQPEVLAASTFTRPNNGSTVSRVHLWDGLAWTLLPGVFQGHIRALYTHDGELFVGGTFGFIDGVATGPIAKWTGTTWEGLWPANSNGTVEAMASYQGRLVIGGTFPFVSGEVYGGIASRLADGTWERLNGGVGVGTNQGNGHIKCLASFGPELFVGGSFEHASGSTAYSIARWNGVWWQSLQGGGGNGVDQTSNVSAMLSTVTGVVVAGPFSRTGGFSYAHSARWDGSTWHPMSDNIDNIKQLIEYNGRLYVGHESPFSYHCDNGGPGGTGLARWTAPGPWELVGCGTSGSVDGLAVFHGELAVAGTFDQAGGFHANNFARWSDSGIPWIALQPTDVAHAPCATTRFKALAAKGYESVGAVSYRWQVERPSGSGLWLDLTDGPILSQGYEAAIVSGSLTSELVATPTDSAFALDGCSFRCRVANVCGSVYSTSVQVHLCFADVNCDGGVDVNDLLSYLGAFQAGDPNGDIDNGAHTGHPDGGIDINDLLFFLARFEAGC
mgnify:CR=1 FL=1